MHLEEMEDVWGHADAKRHPGNKWTLYFHSFMNGCCKIDVQLNAGGVATQLSVTGMTREAYDQRA